MTDTWQVRAQTLVKGRACAGVVTQAGFPTVDPAIFVTAKLDFADYANITRAVAVVAEDVGYTNHLAVVCRIKGIPLLLLADACTRLQARSPAERGSGNQSTRAQTQRLP